MWNQLLKHLFHETLLYAMHVQVSHFTNLYNSHHKISNVSCVDLLQGVLSSLVENPNKASATFGP